MHIRFSYQALTAGKYELGIAGDFTHWKIHSMQDFGGLYLIDFDLLPGRYSYKFIVDGVWKADPSNKLQEADPYGGTNSVIIVEQDNPVRNWEEALERASGQDARSFIKCNRPSRATVELRFSWYPELADEITLLLSDAEHKLYPLGRKSGQMIWHVCLPMDIPSRFHVCIRFKDQCVFLGMNGFHEDRSQLGPLVLNPNDYHVFEVPEWLHESVIYQIFTDRFCNGDPGNDQDFREHYYEGCREEPQPGVKLGAHREYFRLIPDWRDISPLRQSPWQDEGVPDWHCFYGGDIAGVVQKLDYLDDIGINLIYFNPLWEARSNHKYDAADFARPDPHFGTEAEMKNMVELAHARRMRVILDVAFNHSGESFWAFRDTVKKGEKSPWWNWYDWYKWPLPEPLPEDFKPREYYQCWWGIKDMPDLNFDLSRRHPFENYIRDINNAEVNRELVEHILESACYWVTEIGMDGFRLDVPDEVPWWFWELFRARIKALKPDAWLVGEIWHNADAWIGEKYFDSVMNYACFKNPVLEFFVQQLISEADFKLRIEEGLASYPANANSIMMNLLGSHDTQRIRHLAKHDFMRIKHAVFFQMTFCGIPHIYYGDEIGMDGGKDPDNRRPFDWDWEERPEAVDLRAFYKELIRLRKEQELLHTGEFLFHQSIAGLLLYERYNEAGSIVCAINLSSVEKNLVHKGDTLFSYGLIRTGAEGRIMPSAAMCVLRIR